MSTKPTWLSTFASETGLVENVNFGFDNDGMWFMGDESGTAAYPVRSTFELQQTDVCEVVYTVDYNYFCSDQGICFFLSGVSPEWNWDSPNSSRLAFQTNCPNPELSGTNNFANNGGANLSSPNFYTFRVTYDPGLGNIYAETFEGETISGAPINTLVVNDTLTPGNYKIGFGADSDGSEGDESQKAYFKSIDISINGLLTYSTQFGGSNPTNYSYPEIRFRVKTYDPIEVASRMLPDENRENVIRQLQNQTVWILNWPYPLKNGDEFTLYGKEAIKTYKDYQQLNKGNSVLETLYYGLPGGYIPPSEGGTGGSLYFLGNYLTVPASNDWAVGTGDFTVEWFQYQLPTGGNERVFSVNNWPTASLACSMESGVDTFYVWTNGNAISCGYINSIYNDWAHIAIVRLSGTLTAYINGNSVYSTSNSDDITDNSSSLYIGTESTGGSSDFNGYITNFQFVKGTALYNGNFTPPAAPVTPDANSKLLLLASSNTTKLKDSSPLDKTVTNNNNVTWSADTPF